MRIRRSRRGVRSRSHVRGRERNRWDDRFASSFPCCPVPVLFDVVYIVWLVLFACVARLCFFLRSFSLPFWPLLPIIDYRLLFLPLRSRFILLSGFSGMGDGLLAPSLASRRVPGLSWSGIPALWDVTNACCRLGRCTPCVDQVGATINQRKRVVFKMFLKLFARLCGDFVPVARNVLGFFLPDLG